MFFSNRTQECRKLLSGCLEEWSCGIVTDSETMGREIESRQDARKLLIESHTQKRLQIQP
jgi:hypothetical protein